VSPLRCDAKGRLQYSWSGLSGVEPSWELRLQLPMKGSQPLAYLCLFQMEEDRPVLFDLGIVTNGVRTSISDAIQRTVPQDREIEERAHAVGQD